MYRLISCITTEHDYRLVLVAAFVCSLAIVITFKTYGHARQSSDSRRLIWLLLTGFCAATGIWATHFVAMLAYESGVPVSYDALYTIASMLVALVATTAGFAISAGGRTWQVILGGVVTGGGITVMHFTGMAALVAAGTLQWDMVAVAVAVVIGIALTAMALLTFHRHDGLKALLLASPLLILGICGMHFTAMSAATIIPDPRIAIPASGVDSMVLAIAVTGITLLVLIAGGATVIIDKLRIEIASQAQEMHRTTTAAAAAKTEAMAASHAEIEKSQSITRQAEQVFQAELARLVEAAATGDFSLRIDIAGQSGLTARLGIGLNQWADTISHAFNQVSEVMSSMANGAVAKRMEGNYQGDLARLQSDVNSMADKIRAIAKRISGVSREVQGATREIASGVQDLSARTEHQASSLEETSASMEQLAATVRQNSGNAQEANQLAAAASASAVNGGDIAGKAVAAMGKIEDSSRQIGDIVGLIQDIAFQTNLLALNAAVEAARAGEAGKGFAVVANEVRALAQRAGQASKDIKGLIVNSDTQVREGVTLVKQAGSSLTEIVASVKKVAGLVAEIAAATQEQSSGIEQVSKAVSGMDQMTQQNAALVEETNAALHSATSQVDELRKVVSFFKTGEDSVQQDEGPAESEEAYQAAAAAHANPVRQQFQSLARRVASGGASTAIAHDKWKEF